MCHFFSSAPLCENISTELYEIRFAPEQEHDKLHSSIIISNETWAAPSGSVDDKNGVNLYILALNIFEFKDKNIVFNNTTLKGLAIQTEGTAVQQGCFKGPIYNMYLTDCIIL